MIRYTPTRYEPRWLFVERLSDEGLLYKVPIPWKEYQMDLEKLMPDLKNIIGKMILSGQLDDMDDDDIYELDRLMSLNGVVVYPYVDELGRESIYIDGGMGLRIKITKKEDV